MASEFNDSISNAANKVETKLNALQISLISILSHVALPILDDKIREAHTAVCKQLSEIPDVISWFEVTYAYGLNTRAANEVCKYSKRLLTGPDGVIEYDVWRLACLVKLEFDRLNSAFERIKKPFYDSVESSLIQAMINELEWLSYKVSLISSFVAATFMDTDAVEISDLSDEQKLALSRCIVVGHNRITSQCEAMLNVLNHIYGDTQDMLFSKFVVPGFLHRRESLGRTFGNGALDLQQRALDRQIETLITNVNERIDKAQHPMGVLDKLFTLRESYRSALSYTDMLRPVVQRSFNGGNFFEDLPSSSSDQWVMRHDLLDDIDEDDAHNELVLKKGDELTGAVFLEDGVLVDGISPSGHRHRGIGVDGSAQIDGVYIKPQSLESAHAAVEYISPPINLATIEIGGNSAKIAWEGNDPQLMYEIQLLPEL